MNITGNYLTNRELEEFISELKKLHKVVQDEKVSVLIKDLYEELEKRNGVGYKIPS